MTGPTWTSAYLRKLQGLDHSATKGPEIAPLLQHAGNILGAMAIVRQELHDCVALSRNLPEATTMKGTRVHDCISGSRNITGSYNGRGQGLRTCLDVQKLQRRSDPEHILNCTCDANSCQFFFQVLCGWGPRQERHSWHCLAPCATETVVRPQGCETKVSFIGCWKLAVASSISTSRLFSGVLAGCLAVQFVDMSLSD